MFLSPRSIFIGFVIGLVVSFWLSRRFNKAETNTIVKTEFKIDTLTNTIYKYITKTVEIQPQLIGSDSISTKDSTLKQDCDSIRTYTSSYNNDTLDIKYTTKVVGKMLESKLYYNLKLPEKQTIITNTITNTIYKEYFEIYGGAGIGQSNSLFLTGKYKNYILGLEYNFNNSYQIKIGYRLFKF